MQKLYKQLIVCLLVAFVAILAACTKNNAVQPTDSITQQMTTSGTTANQATFIASKNVIVTPITGQWRWIKSNYGEGGLQTPTNTNSTRQADFASDSTVSYFRNDSLLIRINYSYQANFQFPDKSIAAKVVIQGVNHKCTLSNDTLTLATYDVWDGGYDYYVKIKK